jgi:hypothetical protein
VAVKSKIYNILRKICTAISNGDISVKHCIRTLKESVFISDISNSNCDEKPSVDEILFCETLTNFQSDYPFTIGETLEADMVLYGYYNFLTGNPSQVNINFLESDITSQDEHYEFELFETNSLEITIGSPDVCYHVIRISNNYSISIIDAGGLDVTSDWLILSNAEYKYYVLQKAIAPSTVTYILNK